MKVPFLDLQASTLEIKPELTSAIMASLESGQYIGGQALSRFEANFADSVKADFCIGVGNGLDALRLALQAAGVKSGDEVIVPAHTFVATWLAVTACGATPVPVDVNLADYNLNIDLLKEALTPKTAAVVPVHLYGHPADLGSILALARTQSFVVIEDAAQAHGATYQGKPIGSHGDMVAWSFYPGKNLGALGDGGAITTNNAGIAELARRLGNYGSPRKYFHTDLGCNSRLDSLQAAMLDVKLSLLKDWNSRRAKVADRYNLAFKNTDLSLPQSAEGIGHAWHLYCVRHPRRDDLREYLHSCGIETLVHYPIPPYRQPCFEFLDYKPENFPVTESISKTVLSLPMGPSLSVSQIDYVIEKVLEFVHRQ